MKKEKIISIISLFMVVVLCVSLSACGSKETAQDDTTTPTESVSEETTKEKETQHSTAPETTQAKKSQTIKTKYFTMDTPREWDGNFSYEIKEYKDVGSYIIYFQHDKSYEEDAGGHLFSVEVHPESEGYAADLKEFSPSPFDFYGMLNVEGKGDYEVLVTYPSDVQYAKAYKSEYEGMVKSVKELLETIKPVSGAELKKN